MCIDVDKLFGKKMGIECMIDGVYISNVILWFKVLICVLGECIDVVVFFDIKFKESLSDFFWVDISIMIGIVVDWFFNCVCNDFLFFMSSVCVIKYFFYEKGLILY